MVAVGLSATIAGGCNAFSRTEPRALAPAAGRFETVQQTVKVHLSDGTTVIFSGARIGGGAVTALGSGSGRAFHLFDTVAVARRSVPLDSVVGLETFVDRRLVGQTSVAAAAVLAAASVGAIALVGAVNDELSDLFGSCPTIYSDTGASGTLLAEGFSYAIAPLLENRDVDALHVRSTAGGMVRLELRNEALETHQINHLELLHVSHAAGARVVPDQASHPVLLRDTRPPASAIDRAGRDVRAALAAADGVVFASDPRTVGAARAGDLDDWIDVTFDGMPAGDSIAIVLRLRNSLLNTVLLYEDVLGAPDAVRWLDQGLLSIANAIDLSRWYVGTMGLRATVDGGAGAPVRARLGDVGPLAFRDVALVVPRPAAAGRVNVRLRFVADNWRIDRVELAPRIERPGVRVLPIARVVAPLGAREGVDTAAARVLADADGWYLETRPGQRMTLEFRAPPFPPGEEGTYLIVWQGWYSEWIRGDWLARPRRTEPFVPGDAAVARALASWRRQAPAMERAFYASRVPVR